MYDDYTDWYETGYYDYLDGMEFPPLGLTFYQELDWQAGWNASQAEDDYFYEAHYYDDYFLYDE